MTKRLATTQALTVSAVMLLIIPCLVFVSAGLCRGMDLATILSALQDQYRADKNNLFVVSLLGLLPLLLIVFSLGVRKLVRKTWEGSSAYAWGGAIPVLGVALFVNLEFWPRYLPARQFLGFPHGLEFVIGPFVFAPIGVVLGFVFVWFLRRQR